MRFLHEATQIYNVSDRLDSLAEEHPLVSEALIIISGSLRNAATLLEVLVATRMGVARGTGFAKCLICSMPPGSFFLSAAGA
jgi:hypothetical protein